MEVFYARLNGQMVTRLEKTLSKEKTSKYDFMEISYKIFDFFSLV
jgi:hypothetical protein